MQGILEKKKILFFAPAFFGYEFKIKKKMEEMGAEVDFYDERSVVSALGRALLKISPKIFELKSRKYYEEILKKNPEEYDYVFFIKAEMVPISILQEIRSKYKNAKMCLYLYDSVKNIPGILDKLKFFDVKYSFDRKDCLVHPELKLRPLFFADEFRKDGSKTENFKYDISFCGTIHSDRYKIIKAVEKITKADGYCFFWIGYLQSKFMYYYYKITKKEFKGTDISTFTFQKTASSDIAKMVDESKIVLDMQHPKQSGLTMRTIEMVGMGKKLITTNSEITKYDFFKPENICVIDRNNVVIDKKFLSIPYQDLTNVLYEKYSIESWVIDILNPMECENNTFELE